MKTLNEHFADLADVVSETMGRWQATFVALIALLVWVGIGPHYNWDNTWQLIANTPTTWIELFLGLLTLAATNRIDRRNWQLHLQMKEMLENVETLVGKEEEEIKNLIP